MYNKKRVDSSLILPLVVEIGPVGDDHPGDAEGHGIKLPAGELQQPPL